MLEERIARIKALLEQRDKIDAELATLIVIGPRRGRPPSVKKETPDEKSDPEQIGV